MRRGAFCPPESHRSQRLKAEQHSGKGRRRASGVPKLLDFGIAKWLHAEASAQLKTSMGLRPMTPDYASPEQVRGGAITIASDVYTLGVLIYELLTGQRPYHTEGRWLPEVERLICEAEPEQPSITVSRMKAMADEGRAESREALRRLLAGDLDNIILKALQKEPARRYASVQELSEDLRRHLEGRPVSARRDAIAYRSAKFVKRHKVGVFAGSATVAVVLFSVVGGSVWISYQLERNKRLMCLGAENELAGI